MDRTLANFYAPQTFEMSQIGFGGGPKTTKGGPWVTPKAPVRGPWAPHGDFWGAHVAPMGLTWTVLRGPFGLLRENWGAT